MMWSACEKARRDRDEIATIIAENEEHLVHRDLHELMVCALYNNMLCKEKMHSASREDWKEYNREMYNATYPEDKGGRATEDMLKQWVHAVKQHWTMEQTTAVAKQHNVTFDDFTECEFWAIMNVAYSDFADVFPDVPTFIKYSCNWLIDEDSYCPAEKLYRYYHYVYRG